MHFKRHSLTIHLPWYLNTVTACHDCMVSKGNGAVRRRFHGNHGGIVEDAALQAWFLLTNGVFYFIMGELGLASFWDLLATSLTLGLTPISISFSDEEVFFLREYDRRAGLEPLTSVRYMAYPPRRIIALSNYLVLARLLLRLSSTARRALVGLVRFVAFDGSRVPIGHPRLIMGIADVHYHMDILSGDYVTPALVLKNTMTDSFRLLYGIANYVWTESWCKLDQQLRVDPTPKFTLGIHPHRIQPNLAKSSFRKLKDKLARYPSALGIGEVGIDHTSGCACGRCDYGVTCRKRVDAQTEFLELIFQHVKQHDTTLVIHVRDWGNGLAASEVLALLKKYGLQDARIHRHCFIGSAEEYKE